MLHKLIQKFQSSLKVKLVALILFFSLLSLATLAFLLTWKSNQLLFSRLKEEQLTVVSSTADSVADKLGEVTDNLAFIAQNYELDPANPFMDEVLQNILRCNYHYNDLLLIDSSGDYVSASGATGNLSHMQCFSELLTGQKQVSNPFHFSSDEEWELLATVPTSYGLLAAIVLTEDVGENLHEIKIGESGYAYLINQDALLIHHPEDDLVMNPRAFDANPSFHDVVKEMFDLQEGYQEYTFDGIAKVQSFTAIPGTEWILAVTLDTTEFKDQLAIFKRMATGFIVLSCIMLIIAMYFIVDSLSKRIRTIQQCVQEVEGGDLTKRIANNQLQKCWEILHCNKPQCPAFHSTNLRCWQMVGTHCNGEIQSDLAAKLKSCEFCEVYRVSCGDELCQLAESFNSMVNIQMCTVELVTQTAEHVAKAAEDLSGAIQESNAMVEEISASTEELTASSEQMASELIMTADRLNQITDLSHETSRSTLSAREQSLEIEKQANAGEQNAIKTEDKMLKINNETQIMYSNMGKLQEATEEIKKIITAISNVAEQTNLLALNAQIEAARAGEEGLGFAVVANEINDLAGESSRSARQIAEILNRIQKAVQEVSAIMTSEVREISEGLSAVQNLKEQIISINRTLSKTNQSIQNIAELAVAYVEKADVTNQQIQTITQSINESVHSFGTITDSLTEQTANFQEISAASQSLSEISEQLLSAVQYFKVSKK